MLKSLMVDGNFTHYWIECILMDGDILEMLTDFHEKKFIYLFVKNGRSFSSQNFSYYVVLYTK